jgi:hypothetical protein
MDEFSDFIFNWFNERYPEEMRDCLSNYDDFARDSDRSGEAGETGTGSTVGESADPKGIAQTTGEVS